MDAERLDEARREADERSRSAGIMGLPLTFLGAWMLAGTVAWPTAAGHLLLLTLPVAWGAIAAVSLRLRAPTESVEGWGRTKWLPLVASAIIAVDLLDRVGGATWFGVAVPRAAVTGIACAVLLGVAVVALRPGLDWRGPAMLMVTLVVASQGAQDRMREGFIRWFPAGLGAALAVSGVLAHLRACRLGRKAMERLGGGQAT
jgi:hypothetical protein